jgi:hypothetical protein
VPVAASYPAPAANDCYARFYLLIALNADCRGPKLTYPLTDLINSGGGLGPLAGDLKAGQSWRMAVNGAALTGAEGFKVASQRQSGAPRPRTGGNGMRASLLGDSSQLVTLEARGDLSMQ